VPRSSPSLSQTWQHFQQSKSSSLERSNGSSTFDELKIKQQVAREKNNYNLQKTMLKRPSIFLGDHFGCFSSRVSCKSPRCWEFLASPTLFFPCSRRPDRSDRSDLGERRILVVEKAKRKWIKISFLNGKSSEKKIYRNQCIKDPNHNQYIVNSFWVLNVHKTRKLDCNMDSEDLESGWFLFME
jgi:hypothetical protein